ncbi:MAG TPA: DUF4861 family protein [Verrucomicrobiota bacterium]|nr:DUF4861 family protein [Verrucomicrobiota bacterium]
MNTIHRLPVLLAAVALPALCSAAQLTVTAVNKLQTARSSQTIELSAAQLAPLGARELNTIHVKDAAGNELICQAVDTDFDAYRKPDAVIFQSDFAPGETKTFTVTTGAKQVFKKEQYKAFGRFNRERFDDFVWENDRIAHRTYGKGLETWEGEPLTSSTFDIWSKRTPRMVVNDWYLADDYHADHGEGADFYSAGLSRGCGGNGLWAADRLWTSRNFVNSRVLANGPIRVMFELEYAPFEVDGINVSEVKRISLDAGSQLDRFQSSYKQFTRPGQTRKLTSGIGLKKVSGEQVESKAEQGWLLKWEKVEKNAGNQGLAVIVDPKQLDKFADDKLNQLALVKVPEDGVVVYWAGFAWDKAGHVPDAASWKKYVEEFAQGLQSPIEVSVETVK